MNVIFHIKIIKILQIIFPKLSNGATFHRLIQKHNLESKCDSVAGTVVPYDST
jgi:hypothetical protein